MLLARLLHHKGKEAMRALRIFFLVAVLMVIPVIFSEPSQAASPAAITLNQSNPTCTQINTGTGVCVINMRYLSATSNDPTFSHVEISIAGKVRAYYSAFFESSIYVDYSMLGNGLQVSCGLPNAGGDPKYGKEYQIVTTVYLADVPTLTDTANVYCPYFIDKQLLPLVGK
jgi:hypothetical protein